MEEKNLIILPGKVAKYLEYMREGNYTLLDALSVRANDKYVKNLIDDYLESKYNQEKFVRAWLDGYKTEEKFYRVKIKYFEEGNAYLNFDSDSNTFFFSGKEEIEGYITKFTEKFLKDNYLGWMLDSKGIMLLEVEE